MEIDRINPQTVVIHLAKMVTADDSSALLQLLQALYNDGVLFIRVDFALTEHIHKTCLGPLVMVQMKLKDRGGEVSFVNVTGSHVKHLFEMLDLRRIISINEAPC